MTPHVVLERLMFLSCRGSCMRNFSFRELYCPSTTGKIMHLNLILGPKINACIKIYLNITNKFKVQGGLWTWWEQPQTKCTQKIQLQSINIFRSYLHIKKTFNIINSPTYFFSNFSMVQTENISPMPMVNMRIWPTLRSHVPHLWKFVLLHIRKTTYMHIVFSLKSLATLLLSHNWDSYNGRDPTKDVLLVNNTVIAFPCILY